MFPKRRTNYKDKDTLISLLNHLGIIMLQVFHLSAAWENSNTDQKTKDVSRYPKYMQKPLSPPYRH